MSRTGLITLIVANLFVALQTLRHEWGYYETLLIYWSEVVILGGYNVLRLMVVGVVGAAPLGTWAARWVNLGSVLNRFFFTVVGIVFFVVKFGAFAFGIGLFVLLLPAMLGSGNGGVGASIPRALSAAGPGLLIATGALCLSHGVSLIRNFLMGREFDRLDILHLVFWPYLRMFLVGVVLLLGLAVAQALPGLGRETAFAVVMVLLKLLADAASHTLEHRSLMSEPRVE
ncbi:MAG TPA: DUF6498-containing protein [Gemmatimonadales bacterium]|nr:DUF6498-containing protein [Gemmatimonadales bacterium]